MAPYPPSAGFWRLAAAAKLAEMSPYRFARASERGEIPVTVVRLGAHLRFVNAAELTAYLANRAQQPEPDLFK